jgi:hypothetical protein
LGKEILLAMSAYNMNLNAVVGKDNSFPLFANVIGLGMLGVSGEYKDINLLKKMPSSEVNSVNKLNLFNMGYLSRLNAFRTLINNRYVLISMIIIVGFIFYVLFGLAQNSNFYQNIPEVPFVPKTTVPATTTATTTPLFPFIKPTSTKPVITVPATSTASKYNISSSYVFTVDLIPGTNSEAVANLQQRLTTAGVYNGLVGGFFGPATVAALKAYQKANGLAETGALDALTRAKLNGK